jgi:hypothetical protein
MRHPLLELRPADDAAVSPVSHRLPRAPRDKILLSLNVYTNNGLSIAEIERYWLGLLDLPASSVRKHTLDHSPTSSSGRARRRISYGVCTLRVDNTWMLQHIYGAIQEYAVSRSRLGSAGRRALVAPRRGPQAPVTAAASPRTAGRNCPTRARGARAATAGPPSRLGRAARRARGEVGGASGIRP